MGHIYYLSERQNHRCCYCGHHMVRHQHKDGVPLPLNAMTWDHVVPWSIGGRNENNQVVACSLCNELRGNLSANIFFMLQQRWFRKDPTLRERWYSISHFEYRSFLLDRIRIQDKHLRLRARKSVEYAFQHYKLLQNHGYKLRA